MRLENRSSLNAGSKAATFFHTASTISQSVARTAINSRSGCARSKILEPSPN